MRLFHAKCDPKIREETLRKRRARQEENKKDKEQDAAEDAKPFPPEEKDRKFALSRYKAGLCTHCKREDVDPKYAKHPPHVCFRRPGGECDKEGAKTRSERKAVASRMANERARQNRNLNKGDKPKPKGKAKVTHSAVRVHTPAPPTNSAYPPAEGGSNVPATEAPPVDETLVAEPATILKSPKVEDEPSAIRGRKKRPNEYAYNVLACTRPVTEEELTFAMSQCPSFVDREHVLYELQVDGNEDKLRKLREDIIWTNSNLAPNTPMTWDIETLTTSALGWANGSTAPVESATAPPTEVKPPTPPPAKKK